MKGQPVKPTIRKRQVSAAWSDAMRPCNTLLLSLLLYRSSPSFPGVALNVRQTSD